ncbi:MAG TPA: SRPBCC family protein [Holophagaceae bacterium]
MRTFQVSRRIAASREAAWNVLADVAAWPGWLPTVTALEALDGGALKVGARYLLHQPRLRPAVWTVTDLEPGRRFVWQARSPGLRMRAEHILLDESSSSSKVVLRFTFAGPIGGLLGWFYRALTEEYIALEAASLAHRAETLQGPAAPAAGA